MPLPVELTLRLNRQQRIVDDPPMIAKPGMWGRPARPGDAYCAAHMPCALPSGMRNRASGARNRAAGSIAADLTGSCAGRRSSRPSFSNVDEVDAKTIMSDSTRTLPNPAQPVEITMETDE